MFFARMAFFAFVFFFFFVGGGERGSEGWGFEGLVGGFWGECFGGCCFGLLFWGVGCFMLGGGSGCFVGVVVFRVGARSGGRF